ncbi:uncharacterized protein LOC134601394 [Pelobates fuscus]|uniref:uncharacterized protein LOC134601394 n=1 Tax=Pelobates fuscus TaxID=191477 RepID=UPI002FE4692B
MHFGKSLLVFSAIIICASAAHFLEQEWNLWKSEYGKKYVTPDSELFRRKAWEATWDKVQKHNKLADQGLKNYRLGMNQFADMTEEESKSQSCLRLNGKFTPLGHSQNYYGKRANIPDEVDYRKTKCVTKIKQQGLCGSCWAFATVGVLETRYCLEKDELLVLSEQQLVDCDEEDEGCCGGLPVNALAYVSHNGIMRSKDYEYEEKQATCGYKNDKAIMLNVTKFYILPGEENMAVSVALNGPITVGIGSTHEFQLYKGGIYDGDCAAQPNHAVIIVGYGTEKGEDDEEEDYWIIKNSWGEAWGENGFGRMKRNVNKCNIADMASTMDFTMP